MPNIWAGTSSSHCVFLEPDIPLEVDNELVDDTAKVKPNSSGTEKAVNQNHVLPLIMRYC